MLVTENGGHGGATLMKRLTKMIIVETVVIAVLAGSLYSEYLNNVYMREYVDGTVRRILDSQPFQGMVSLGNSMISPLRILTLSLLSLVTILLLLLLIFMFATFLISLVNNRDKGK